MFDPGASVFIPFLFITVLVIDYGCLFQDSVTPLASPAPSSPVCPSAMAYYPHRSHFLEVGGQGVPDSSLAVSGDNITPGADDPGTLNVDPSTPEEVRASGVGGVNGFVF